MFFHRRIKAGARSLKVHATAWIHGDYWLKCYYQGVDKQHKE
jgi:hypothetical protein